MFITSQFPSLGFDQFWISSPEFIEFRDRNKAFERVGGYRAGSVNLGTEQPSRVNSIIVTHELMEALDVQAAARPPFTRKTRCPRPRMSAFCRTNCGSASSPVTGVIGRVVRSTACRRDSSASCRRVRRARRESRAVAPADARPGESWQPWRPLLFLVGRTQTRRAIGQARADLESLLDQWAKIAPNTHVPNRRRTGSASTTCRKT